MSDLIRFDWFDTPNPTERGFYFDAGENDQDCDIPDFLNQTVLFSDCPSWITHNAQVRPALAGYRLIFAEKSGVLRRRFYFGKSRTEEERNTAFKTRWIKRMWHWDTVLLKLWFEEGNLPLTAVDADGDIQTAKRVHERSRYRQGKMYPTWFRIRHFLSEQPFSKKRQITPITDSIHWSFDGHRGGFPECLHPGAKFTSYQTSGNVLFGMGTPGVEVGSDIVAQEFPPTAMQDWEKYPIEDDRREVVAGGIMEHRTLVEAIPPIDDRENLG